MKFFQEFKQFAMRGNVIDMAVGVILGGAFGKIVSSLVSDIIMPPIGLLVGNVNFSEIKIPLKSAGIDAAGNALPAVTINIGTFINVFIDFILVAFSIFIVIKAINSFHKKTKAAEVQTPPAPTKDQELLTEIRDLLKNK